MNLKRMLCASTLATSVGLAGLLGTGIATANAAPDPKPPAPATVKLDHHQRKEVLKQENKQLKHPQQITPAASSGH